MERYHYSNAEAEREFYTTKDEVSRKKRHGGLIEQFTNMMVIVET